ncbi:MAG TPA: DUF2946 family protein [Burkholderiales bacterium]|jgi:hypothetical protein
MRKIGTWLGVLAIALHALWPLLANARPTSVNLVPICTVEGITHYLEVPGGSTPLDDSATAHHDHCAFCFLGAGGLLASHADFPLPLDVAAERIAPSVESLHARAGLHLHGARAPPVSPVVISAFDNLGRHDEQALGIGRAGLGAPDSSRFLRFGVLHR